MNTTPAPSTHSKFNWPGIKAFFDPNQWGPKTARISFYTCALLLFFALWWRSGTATEVTNLRTQVETLTAERNEARRVANTSNGTAVTGFATTQQAEALAKLLSELQATINTIAEKPAPALPTLEGLAKEESITSILEKIEGLPARIPNPDLIAWLKSDEGKAAIRACWSEADLLQEADIIDKHFVKRNLAGGYDEITRRDAIIAVTEINSHQVKGEFDEAIRHAARVAAKEHGSSGVTSIDPAVASRLEWADGMYKWYENLPKNAQGQVEVVDPSQPAQ